jgi:hypothetical protein
MTTPYTELFCDQGATFNHIINLTDDVTNAPVNVANLIVSSMVRRSHFSLNPSANIICQITSAGEGEITLTMPSTVTANLKPGRFVFDVKAIDPVANTVSRLLEGIITVSPSVTR